MAFSGQSYGEQIVLEGEKPSLDRFRLQPAYEDSSVGVVKKV